MHCTAVERVLTRQSIFADVIRIFYTVIGKLLNSCPAPASMAAMKYLLSLIGVVLILESLPYVACPEAMQKWLRQLSEVNPAVLRVIGLLAMGAGLLLCYLTQQTHLI